MPKYHSLRGMPDITPDEARLFRWIEDKAREVLSVFEFSEIRTPVLEETGLFTRSIGEDTDIVEKEMYSFQDRGGKSVSMRPEGTAPIIRAYIEHGWHKDNDVVKLYCAGPMFRGERPQKGRLRQFHQIGAEMIGSSSPYVDAELLSSLKSVFDGLGVEGYRINLNSIGCKKDREKYKKELFSFLSSRESELCENCKRRMHTNVLRVLDCKSESCRAVVKNAPLISAHLCGDCADFYGKLKEILRHLHIDFNEKPDMVRGLDYYTGTVFEVSHPALGAQDAVAAGGRYDGLAGELGGPEVGATGYAIGMERLILAIKAENIPPVDKGVLVIALDELSMTEAFMAARALRKAGVPAGIDHSGRTLKGGLRKANREARKHVIIIGEDERNGGKVLLKDMGTGSQETMTIEEAIGKLSAERK